MTLAKFRPFKIPAESSTLSFSPVSASDLQEYMEADLGASGLTPDDIGAYVHTKAGVQGAKFTYVIPYYHPDGQPIVDKSNYLVMFRKKIHPPVGKKKYDQPSGNVLSEYGLPRFMPYISPNTIKLQGDTLYICEGEKKTAAFMKHMQLPAVGIGGCQAWHDPDNRKHVHPWILKVIRGKSIEKIVVIPDGDLWKFDICKAYGDFGRALQKEELTVQIVDMPDKLDDLLVKWEEPAAEFNALTFLQPSELMQSSESLIDEFNLPYKLVGKDQRRVVVTNESTAKILLENHPAFSEMWWNSDKESVFIGETQYDADVHPVDILTHMQQYLDLPTLRPQHVEKVIPAIARKTQRSPFLDRIKGLEWDATPRLETWLIDHWGIADTPMAREIGVKWLVAACARAAEPGCVVDWMFIVTGAQGTGKTSMPKLFFNDHVDTMYGEVRDKDLQERIVRTRCMILDEMSAFGKKDQEHWKSVITSRLDTFRAAFGKGVREYPRKALLYGTTNRHDVVHNDISGYRRYGILEPTRKLNFEWVEENSDQLWAEAWNIYEVGLVDYSNLESEQETEQYVAEDNYLEFAIKAIEDLERIGAHIIDNEFRIQTINIIVHAQEEYSIRLGSNKIVDAFKVSGYASKPCRIPGEGVKKRWVKHVPNNYEEIKKKW